MQAEERQMSDGLKTMESELLKSQNDIEDENRRLDERHQGGHARRSAHLEQCKAEVEAARAQLLAHEASEQQLQADRQQAARDMKEEEKLQETLCSRIRATQNRLTELREQNTERPAQRPNVQKLLHLISQDGLYRHKPIGPIGGHVQLNEPAWSSILEKSLGATLDGFIVTCKQDQDRLSAAMRSANW